MSLELLRLVDMGEFGTVTDSTGSASILEGEQTATATPKTPTTPAT